jgi:polygalacturonase
MRSHLRDVLLAGTPPIALSALAWAAEPAAPVPTGICNVRAFGAAGDGQHNDTAAINAAIRSCALAGSGTVEFGAGT